MIVHWKITWNLCIPVLLTTLGFSLALTTIPLKSWDRSYNSQIQLPPNRQSKTLDMTKGMNLLRDMLQNGMAFRPVPPPIPALKNLFKVQNGTQLTWVPLGSLMFNNNGKIIGG